MSRPNRAVMIEELADGTFVISSNFEPGGERHEMRGRWTEHGERSACSAAIDLFTEPSPTENMTLPRALRDWDKPPIPRQPDGDDIPF
jgi:hypothetical protein